MFNNRCNIQIRFNTKNNGGPLPWRIFVNNTEHLASHVDVYGHVYGEPSFENGIQKYNISCIGKIKWNGTRAIIKAKNK